LRICAFTTHGAGAWRSFICRANNVIPLVAMYFPPYLHGWQLDISPHALLLTPPPPPARCARHLRPTPTAGGTGADRVDFTHNLDTGIPHLTPLWRQFVQTQLLLQAHVVPYCRNNTSQPSVSPPTCSVLLIDGHTAGLCAAALRGVFDGRRSLL